MRRPLFWLLTGRSPALGQAAPPGPVTSSAGVIWSVGVESDDREPSANTASLRSTLAFGSETCGADKALAENLRRR
jgi:hypothetical protein